MTPSLLIAALFCALGVALALWRANQSRIKAHAAYFDAVSVLFDRVIRRIEPSGFPRLTGQLNGQYFDVQAIPDSLSFRKLPALWVMVTLPEPMPVAATLDIMARPTGYETFSRFNTLPHALPCPSFLPDGTGVRSDEANNVPPADLVERHSAVFADDRTKELLIAPNGLRLVVLADEAERGRYLLFRDAELGPTPLPAVVVHGLMVALLALKADLSARALTATQS
ncbi:MAG: hypothetical protein ABIV25_04030 [Paracoccaceae bacterium]